ncbi:MAG TPA: hypothetical protein VFW73_05300 [Lacipirellulaceae bacterium]|nr:hypothetical protein [Lacipirellulaceae bacterium]
MAIRSLVQEIKKMKKVLIMVFLVAAMPLAGCNNANKKSAKPAVNPPATGTNAPAGKEMPAPAPAPEKK